MGVGTVLADALILIPATTFTPRPLAKAGNMLQSAQNCPYRTIVI